MKPLYLCALLHLTLVTTMASAQSTNQDTTTRVSTGEPDTSMIHAKAMVDTAFPGGSHAWLRFLNKTLRYPDNAVNDNIMGTVVVQFTVHADSTVSDVQAISGPTDGGLRKEAARLVGLSGKWIPAVENGVQVSSIKQVPIRFLLIEEPPHHRH
jgi:periplasmic protein TonB